MGLELGDLSKPRLVRGARFSMTPFSKLLNEYKCRGWTESAGQAALIFLCVDKKNEADMAYKAHSIHGCHRGKVYIDALKAWLHDTHGCVSQNRCYQTMTLRVTASGVVCLLP